VRTMVALVGDRGECIADWIKMVGMSEYAKRFMGNAFQRGEGIPVRRTHNKLAADPRGSSCLFVVGALAGRAIANRHL